MGVSFSSPCFPNGMGKRWYFLKKEEDRLSPWGLQLGLRGRMGVRPGLVKGRLAAPGVVLTGAPSARASAQAKGRRVTMRVQQDPRRTPEERHPPQGPGAGGRGPPSVDSSLATGSLPAFQAGREDEMTQCGENVQEADPLWAHQQWPL